MPRSIKLMCKKGTYQTFIYLFYYLLHATVWWRVEKPQALKDVGRGGMYVCTIYLSAIYVWTKESDNAWEGKIFEIIFWFFGFSLAK